MVTHSVIPTVHLQVWYLATSHWKHCTLDCGFIIKYTNRLSDREIHRASLEESPGQEALAMDLEVLHSPGTLKCSLTRKLHQALVFRFFIWGFVT